MHSTKGHVWGNRFYSRIIEDERDFMTVSAYILKGMLWLVDELLEGGAAVSGQSAAYAGSRRTRLTVPGHVAIADQV
jgi:hypothetical protein